MIIQYLLLGALIAIIGAIPLGAVNLAVIHTSITKNIKNAVLIAIAAGVGEIFLAFFALRSNMKLSDFFLRNQWIQISFIVTFFFVGLYFMYLASKTPSDRKKRNFRILNSKFLTGFSLALLNPPVIIYWILAISITNKYFFALSTKNSIITLLLFFLGVYLGKIGTLYFYAKWANKMAQKPESSKTKFHRLVGIALIAISFFQGLKFMIA